MGFFDTLFGGTDDSAQVAQLASNERAQQFIERMGAQARGDALNLAPAARDDINLGFQGALDVLGQSIPQQLSTLQSGNVGAQEQLLAGLPQVQNAILGNPTDFSGLQPRTISFDSSFANQSLPQNNSITAMLAGMRAQQPAQSNSLQDILAGIVGGSGGNQMPTGQSTASFGNNRLGNNTGVSRQNQSGDLQIGDQFIGDDGSIATVGFDSGQVDPGLANALRDRNLISPLENVLSSVFNPFGGLEMAANMAGVNSGSFRSGVPVSDISTNLRRPATPITSTAMTTPLAAANIRQGNGGEGARQRDANRDNGFNGGGGRSSSARGVGTAKSGFSFGL